MTVISAMSPETPCGTDRLLEIHRKLDIRHVSRNTLWDR